MNHEQLSTSRKRRRVLIGAAIFGAATFLVGPSASAVEDAPTTPAIEAAIAAPAQATPEPTPPTGLGTDANFNALAQSCFDGDLESCDTLYWRTPIDSPYEAYGSTCAGRVPDGTNGGCERTLGTSVDTPMSNLPAATTQPTGLGSDAALDQLAQQCFDGAMFACDKMYVLGDEDSQYESYGDTCAGRQPGGSGSFCHELLGFPPPNFDVSTLPQDLDPITLERALACHVGDMSACDDVYRLAAVDSVLENFGDSCAGRQASDTLTLCTSAFPSYTQLTTTTTPVQPTAAFGEPTAPSGLGSDAQFELLAQACFSGDLLSCDYLYWRSPIGSPYEQYGTTCGGRTTDLISGQCHQQVVAEPTTPIPAATTPATGLGTEAGLNGLAEQCFNGALFACDRLYLEAPTGSPYGSYADTCAGRQPENSGAFCHELIEFPRPTSDFSTLPTDDYDLLSLAGNCFIGDMQSCDDLYRRTEPGSPFKAFSDTCAGRQAEGTNQYCTDSFPAYTQLFGTDTATAGTTGTTSAPVPTTTAAATTGVVPAPTQQPTGLGADANLNGLAQRCFDGDLGACDDLYFQSPDDSAYKTYGDTCAGRQAAGTGRICTRLD